MDITEPAVDLHFMPAGSERVVYAEDQPEYLPLPSFRTPDGRVVSAWKPNPGELALLNNGVPIYLTLHTFNKPLQPVMLTVGPPDLR